MFADWGVTDWALTATIAVGCVMVWAIHNDSDHRFWAWVDRERQAHADARRVREGRR